jgi:hypothetical protein
VPNYNVWREKSQEKIVLAKEKKMCYSLVYSERTGGSHETGI